MPNNPKGYKVGANRLETPPLNAVLAHSPPSTLANVCARATARMVCGPTSSRATGACARWPTPLPLGGSLTHHSPVLHKYPPQVAAYLMDVDSFSSVPPTLLVHCEHPGNSPSRRPSLSYRVFPPPACLPARPPACLPTCLPAHPHTPHSPTPPRSFTHQSSTTLPAARVAKGRFSARQCSPN